MPTILITDSLFIGPDEEASIRNAGYGIERLDKPKATEQELMEAVRGKVGYILGGIEEVTDQVIKAADGLRVIAFTGSGFTEFIPGWRTATRRGIAISAATGENAASVAEWALVVGLALVRKIPALTAPKGPDFYISREFAGLTLGIIGFGNVGRALATKAMGLGIAVVATPSSRGELRGVKTAELNEVLSRSDLVSIHVDKERGVGVLDSVAIQRIRPNAVLINAAFEQAIDNDALIKRLQSGDLRAAVDYPLSGEGIPVGSLLASNGQTAFNTAEANARISPRTTSSLLNLLRSGNDPDLVNPDFRSYR